MAAGVHLYLLPDWAPSISPAVVRFDALVKVAHGAVIEVAAPFEVWLFDAAGQRIGASRLAPEAAQPSIVGPAWRSVSGRHVKIDAAVVQAEATLGAFRSERRDRSEALRAVALEPIRWDLGLAREPHLWWRFTNHGPAPVAVDDVTTSTVLWLDGRELPAPAAPYNGPSHLPPGRSLSGLWSFDDLDPPSRKGVHRLQLGVLGERSEEIECAWSDG